MGQKAVPLEAKRFFIMDRILTVVNCIIYFLAQCCLNQPGILEVGRRASSQPFQGRNARNRVILAVARVFVYTLGFCRLLYWHGRQACIAYRQKVPWHFNPLKSWPWKLHFARVSGRCLVDSRCRVELS